MCTSFWLESARFFIEQTILTLGYAGVGFLMLLENAFPPLPSELVVPFAGFLIHERRLSFGGVLFASTLGTLIGTSLVYLLGRVLGEARLRHFIGRWGRLLALDEARFDAALAYFRRYEAPALFWGRLVPGLRSVVSLPAGVARTPLLRFWFYSALGGLVWNTALLAAGLWLGANWTEVLGLVDRYEVVLIVALGFAAGAILCRRWRRANGLHRPLE